MKFLRVIVAVLVWLTLGCQRPDPEVSERLDRAEAMVMTDADAAVGILQEIDFATIRDKDSQARYQLLTSMARYRLNDYSHPEADSLLTFAIERFGRRSDLRRQMQGLFLRADLRRMSSAYSDAMTDALRANELADCQEDADWKARSCEQIADLFCATQNFREALPYIDKAIEHYRTEGKERNVRFALCDKAAAMERMDQTDASIQLLDSLIHLSAEAQIDTVLMTYCLRTLYPIYFDNKQWEDGLHALLELKAYGDSSDFQSPEYSYLALSYIQNNNFEEAKHNLDIAKALASSDYDKRIYNKILVPYYSSIGNITGTTKALNDYQASLYHSLREHLRQSTLSAQSDFFHNKATAENQHKRKIVAITLCIIICLIVAIAIIGFYNHVKTKRKNREIENKIAEILYLSDQLIEAQAQLCNQSSQFVLTTESVESAPWVNFKTTSAPEETEEINYSHPSKSESMEEAPIAALKSEIEKTLHRTMGYNQSNL